MQPRRRGLLQAALALPALPALAQTPPWPSRPVRIVIPFTPGGSNDAVGRPLAERLHAKLGQPFVIDHRILEVAADMRYHGQAFELLVPWGEVATPDAAALEALKARFHAMHQQRFSYSSPEEAVEIVTLRVTAIGRLDKPNASDATAADRPARKQDRRVHIDGAWRDIPVWDRDALRAGDRITGPAIVEEPFATHVITTGWTAAPGAAGALIATRSQEAV